MRRNDIKNKKLMSALTIGISAMMALSTPISAYASENGENIGGGDPVGDNTPSTESQGQEQSAPSEAPTEAAQEQADTVQTETESASAESAEAAGAILEDLGGNAQQEAGAVIDTTAEAAVLAGDNANVGPIAEEVINQVVEAAAAVVNDTTDENDKVVESAVHDFEKATADVENAKSELKAADEQSANADAAQKAAEESTKDAGDNAKEAQKWADNILADTQDAQTELDALATTINEAGSVEEATQASEELEQLVEASEAQLELKKQYYQDTLTKYNKALEELKEAEDALEEAERLYAEKVAGAKVQAVDAQNQIKAAQEVVDELAGALDVAEVDLQAEADASAAYGTNTGGGNWDKKRAAMYKAVEGYVISQLEGQEITNVTWKYYKGIDKQDYNYNLLTYYVNGQKVERYFNYDNLDKVSTGDIYTGLGSSYGIAVYEKTKDEIKANDTLVKKYGNNVGDYKNKVKNGEFTVYAYGEGADRQYIAQKDLDAMVASEQAVNNNGVYTIGGVQLEKIVQNQNSILHDGNVYIVATSDEFEACSGTILNNLKAGDKRTDEEAQALYDNMKAYSDTYNAFMNNHTTNADGTNQHKLAEQFSGYKTAVAEAQAAITSAEAEAKTLTDMIDALDQQKRARTVLAKDALGVDDIATYLGLNVSAEEAAKLNKMTAKEAVEVFNDYLKEANDKVEQANKNMADLKDSYQAAMKNFEEVVTRLTPKPSAPINVPAAVVAAESGGGGGADQDAPTYTVNAAAAAATAAIQAAGGPAAAEAGGAAVQPGAAVAQAGGGAVQAGGAGGAAQEIQGGAGQTIQDEATPTEAVAPVADDEQILAEASGEEAITANIADEDTATADSADMPVKAEKMNWWWALILLILGERGRELYVKYKKDLKDEKES